MSHVAAPPATQETARIRCGGLDLTLAAAGAGRGVKLSTPCPVGHGLTVWPHVGAKAAHIPVQEPRLTGAVSRNLGKCGAFGGLTGGFVGVQLSCRCIFEEIARCLDTGNNF